MEASSQPPTGTAYPVRFSVEYPDRDLNRLTTAFRIILAIPILIVAGTIDGETYGAAGEQSWAIGAGGGGLVILASACTWR